VPRKERAGAVMRLLRVLLLLSVGLVPYAANPPALEAQAVSPLTEAWVLYEQARALQEDRNNPEPGEALYLYRQAIERAEIFPEAEMAIGEIYLREGAFALAEEQFKKALQYSAAFLIPERKYVVRYRLAELYELQERYADMEKELMAIVVDQQQYAGASPLKLTDVVLDTYFRRGLDQVFTLYRTNDSTFAMTAHAKLGWMKYRTGQFNPGSITHSLFALNIVVTEAVGELRRTVPDFVYTTLDDFVRAGLSRPAVRSYLIESGFAEMLYYLATATFAAAKPLRAREVWTSIAAFDPQLAGPYRELARRQLREPWVDGYLNPSPRIIEYPRQ
jgi:tetratricopeptide (TPR) repeat protein